jgi:hypothetical protein
VTLSFPHFSMIKAETVVEQLAFLTVDWSELLRWSP